MLQQGFSFGIEDTIIDATTMEVINEIILKAKNGVKQFINVAQDKKSEAKPSQTMMESYENK